MEATIQRIATKAVLENDDGRVLILREADTYQEGTNHGRYHLPGGRINIGEPFLQGLERELREETGLIGITIGAPLYIGEWYPVIKGAKNHIVAIFFACRIRSSKVALSDEHDAYAWILPAEMDQYDIIPPDPNAILAWAKQRS